MKQKKPIQLGDFSVNDLKQVAKFKKVVKNYMRMKKIEDETEIVICNRVNRTDNNRCINCGAKTGHPCQMKPDKSNYCECEEWSSTNDSITGINECVKCDKLIIRKL